MRIAVLGAGALGTALASHASSRHEVALWSRDPAVAEVKVVGLTLNVSPTTALSGSTAESTKRATTAPFRLNVVFKPML